MSVYLKIADNLKKQIKLGVLPAGSQLPQEIEFAKKLSITRKTLRNALNILDQENLIVRKKRSGTFIVDNARKIVKAKFEICVAGDFGSAENKNFFISSLTGDSHSTEALIAVQKLLNDNIRLSFVSSRNLGEIPSEMDGFIIVDSIHSSDLLKKLADEKIPHISFETHLNHPGVNTVMADDAGAARKSVMELHKKGHRKIAFHGGAIKKRELNTGIRRRTEAFEATCNELGIDRKWIYNFDETVESVPSFDTLSDKLLAEAFECSAVVCALGKGALSLSNAAKQKHIEIPRDMEMICIDAQTFDMLPDEIEKLRNYPGFIKPREQIASEGIKRLFEWIGNGDNYKPECRREPFLQNFQKE